MYHRLPEESQISDRKQDAQFRGTKAPEGEAKFAQGVRRQIGLDRQHQKSDEQADCDVRMHVSGEGQSAHQGESAKAVDHVVNVEPVARTLALADAGECAVERIAQPVESEAYDRAKESVGIARGQRVA